MADSVAPTSTDAIRVLLCAGADIVAVPVRAALDGADGIALVAEVADGVSAVSAIRRHEVDVVLLDIGLGEQATSTTMSRLAKADEGVRIVMVGSVSFANIRTSMKGMMAGAVEYVPTPTKHSARTDERQFKSELLRVLRGLGRRAEAKSLSAKPTVKPAAPAGRTRTIPVGSKKPKVLLVGSSTGGPQAVATFLSGIGPGFPLPILITQHMPKGFTALFAQNLTRKSGIPVAEGVDGETIQPGRVYIAPGGLHMEVAKQSGVRRIKLTDAPPVNYCKPAVDPLFESAADAYDGHVLAVVLTGMGYDGRNGARPIVERGGTVLAQDEATSVVWGMPGGVTNAGLAADVLPLEKIAARVRELI